MAVTTVRVVAEQQVGVLVRQQASELARGLLNIGPREPGAAWRVLEQDRSVPAVGVAQMHGLVRAEDRRAGPQRRQPLALMLVRPYLTVGGHDDDHPMALGREPGDRPPRQQHLIVRMGMKRNDRCHTRQPNCESAALAACRETLPIQPTLTALYATVQVRGRIDIVFANAGVGEFARLEAVTEEHFDKIFNTNVKGALFTVQKALPVLNDGGSIILTGSVASAKGTPPEGRVGEPAEVAKAALFLASDGSSFVSGIELFVDGGRAQIRRPWPCRRLRPSLLRRRRL